MDIETPAGKLSAGKTYSLDLWHGVDSNGDVQVRSIKGKVAVITHGVLHPHDDGTVTRTEETRYQIESPDLAMGFLPEHVLAIGG